MKKECDANIGLILKERRLDKKLTLDHIAEKLYMTKQAYHKKEKGFAGFKVDILGRLSEILDLKFIINKDKLTIIEGDTNMKKDVVLNNAGMNDNLEIVKKYGEYAIIKVYSNSEHGIYGNIVNTLNEALLEREEALITDSKSKIMEGYCVYHLEAGIVPNDAIDWHKCFESAEKELCNFYESKVNYDKSKIRDIILDYLEGLKNSLYNVINSYTKLLILYNFFVILNYRG